MRAILMLAGLTLFISCSGQSDMSIKEIAWMMGNWERTDLKPGKKGYEIWSLENADLVGMGVSITGSDTTFVEKLRIELVNNVFYYVAEVPGNSEPTRFEVTVLRQNYLKCENPTHDFPKEIIYERDGERLTAIIAAGQKKMSFAFREMK
ncbi:DUF6265 family protein [Marinoscillum pacificum]|uniref:DUF6265 family protein n=1 Tax=Marinoscillum pacificum TaxID=392723 RepID=UPI0021588B0D|nr:DUF6265 family protein [Marinoscillum pacificum]